uniref:Transmembrane and coiled-coil domains 4 n=1 Tax=Salarias fasciatus TaxID=181472 RepID=A0A672J6M3_SALFA
VVIWVKPLLVKLTLCHPVLKSITSRQLTEQSRFAYAALCGVSLGQLFTGSENSVFREQYLQGLVRWLDLDDSVMPVMGAFLSGLGFEGSDTFLSILQAEPLLAQGSTPIIQDLVSFSVKDGQYDSRARVLIRHVGCLLRVSPHQLEEFEETLGERLREGGEESEEESSRRRRRERGRKLRRYLLIGLATVGGGTVIGVTGGLAAPLVAAGAGAVLGAGGAAALGSATGIAIMASLFGAAGAGLTGYKMNKCVGAIEEFQFLPLNSGKHLHVTIAVTGWLCSGKYSSFQAPWGSLGDCGEQYCLVWESRFLRDLGSAMASLLDGLVSMMAQEALKYTVLSGIVTALTLPASLLAAASVIDNPWCVCLNRSAEVGKHLAQVLRSRQQGKRPVSLIGFSLGARVIYYCLQELASSEGVVEDVVLLGAPVDGSEKAWERMARVVAGKIVNGYCRGDWLLGFLYRSSAAQLSVAGLQPVNVQDRRIVNVDLSSVVSHVFEYREALLRGRNAVLFPLSAVCKHSSSVPMTYRWSILKFCFLLSLEKRPLCDFSDVKKRIRPLLVCFRPQHCLCFLLKQVKHQKFYISHKLQKKKKKKKKKHIRGHVTCLQHHVLETWACNTEKEFTKQHFSTFFFNKKSLKIYTDKCVLLLPR